jgi:hypothetical protein
MPQNPFATHTQGWSSTATYPFTPPVAVVSLFARFDEPTSCCTRRREEGVKSIGRSLDLLRSPAAGRVRAKGSEPPAQVLTVDHAVDIKHITVHSYVRERRLELRRHSPQKVIDSQLGALKCLLQGSPLTCQCASSGSSSCQRVFSGTSRRASTLPCCCHANSLFADLQRQKDI